MVRSISLVASVLFFSMCSDRAPAGEVATASGPDRIEVLDFHTDHRCHTCLTIEELTKTVLAETYGEEMEKGTITFQLINVDREENLPVAQKFGAFGTSLVLNVVKDGEEKQVNLTDFAFLNAENEAKFTEGLKEHLQAELQNMRL